MSANDTVARVKQGTYNRHMTERRYGDEDVREILRLATANEAQDRALPAESGGLSLVELQQIAKEAGIEPARVAQAAAMLEARNAPAPVRRHYGMPVGVSRVIGLPRAPTEREWEQLIATFRSTFGAQGVAKTEGGIRDWSNGDLHISVEPTAHGEQLRLSTTKTDAFVLNVAGTLFGAMSLVMGATVAAAGKPEKAIAVLGMFGGLALAAFAANVLRLPSWARTRERQFTALAEQTVKMLSEG